MHLFVYTLQEVFFLVHFNTSNARHVSVEIFSVPVHSKVIPVSFTMIKRERGAHSLDNFNL